MDLRILFVDDSPDDTRLMLHHLSGAGLEPRSLRVESEGELREALAAGEWQVALVDYNLPGFGGPEALRLLAELAPDTLTITVSGATDEETAVTTLRAGAVDYVLKSNLARLVPAVERAVADGELRRERRLAEAALREGERVLGTLMGNLPGMAYRCANDRQWTMEFVSAGCEELTGYAPEALIGNARLAFAELVAPSYREAGYRDIQAAIDRDEAWTITYPIVTAAGETKWIWERGVAVRDATGEVEALEGLDADITAQHEAEGRLATALAEWRQTFDAMSDSVALFDAEGVVLRANAATKALSGRDYGAIVGHACHEVFHGSATYHPSCPHQRAQRSGHAETSLLEQDGHWLRATFQPIFDADGTMSGGVHVVTDVTDLEEARRQLLESVAQQQVITDGVIAAIAATTEVRDPYTAGHQRRVSELAAAIARDLGFDEDRLAGVRVTAMVHDVGKITIPAEVLSRPGRLSAIEFELIKAHAQASHDILSPITFTWPVADVALQHHERLDGSGYPRGLTADAILLEARIIAVADVVEAMSSHRPYRAALGMDAALEEVRGGAGVRYDADVVASCLRVVEEQGFSFMD